MRRTEPCQPQPSRKTLARSVGCNCRAGASGYLAGRSIWRDAVSTHDPAARDAAVAGARARLDELNAITRANGRPYVAAHSLADVTQAMSDGWFERWHPSG